MLCKNYTVEHVVEAEEGENPDQPLRRRRCQVHRHQHSFGREKGHHQDSLHPEGQTALGTEIKALVGPQGEQFRPATFVGAVQNSNGVLQRVPSHHSDSSTLLPEIQGKPTQNGGRSRPFLAHMEVYTPHTPVGLHQKFPSRRHH